MLELQRLEAALQSPNLLKSNKGIGILQPNRSLASLPGKLISFIYSLLTNSKETAKVRKHF